MPSNFNLSPNDRKAQESYAVGTRDLVFLQINVNCATDNLSTDYTASDSNFQRLLQVLQQRLEIYGVGEPNSSNEVTVIAARSTIPYTGNEEQDAGGNVTVLEDMIDASEYFSSSNVFQGQINGWSIENDC